MEAESLALLEQHAPVLADVFRDLVDECVLVSTSWTWRKDGPFNSLRADFAPVAETGTLGDLLGATVEGLVRTGRPQVSFGERAVFTEGKGVVRVGSAQALLIENLLPVMRLDWQEEGASSFRGDSGPWGELFAQLHVQPVELEREIFYAVDPLPGGEIMKARWSCADASALRGFREDKHGYVMDLFVAGRPVRPTVKLANGLALLECELFDV